MIIVLPPPLELVGLVCGPPLAAVLVFVALTGLTTRLDRRLDTTGFLEFLHIIGRWLFSVCTGLGVAAWLFPLASASARVCVAAVTMVY